MIALYHCSSKHGFDFGTTNTLQLSKEVVDVCVCVCVCVCACVWAHVWAYVWRFRVIICILSMIALQPSREVVDVLL